MVRQLRLLLALVMLATPIAARAEEKRLFDVPSESLSRALPILSRQGHVSISVADQDLWQSRVRAVRGRMTASRAIALMLDKSDAQAVQVGETSWRIERRTLASRRKPSTSKPVPRTTTRPPPPSSVDPPLEIVVTASKTALPYSHYAGIATFLDGDDLAFGGERGTESILSRLSTLSSTHLGSGRNKLFIRGIADSSFTGPTQGTVGQYLGDVRLTYNAPDPDLRLYDIQSVEVLEGPQGTLYGAGSLGGIIRIQPKPPDPDATELQAIAGLSLTQHGDPGGDLAAIANIPLGDTGHAIRLVGYTLTEGGYIDNPMLGENDVNRLHVYGGRGTLRLAVGEGWTIDIGGIYQATISDDAQYADRDAPPLTRDSQVEQRANARYGSAMLVVTKDWDHLHFQTSNAFVDHRLAERFDASLPDGPPRVLDQNIATRMFTSETRLSRPFHDGLGWVLGFSVVDNRARQQREFGGLALRTPATGVSNTITEITGYGEATVELLPDLVASTGLRFSHAKLGGMGEDVPLAIAIAGQSITAYRNEHDLLPSASLLATPIRNVSIYARYQEGFRPGGLAIDGGFVGRFRNDHVSTYEAGIRFAGDRNRPIDATLSVSHTRWRDIQADFVDGNGFPTTANIGNGRITSVSASVTVRPTPALSLELGAVYNHSRVDQLSPLLAQFSLSRLGHIPNVASHAVRGAVNYTVALGGADLRFNGWANYIGPSRLGIGPVLGDSQGDYVDTGLAARIGDARRGVSMTLTNLFDAKGNRFALGSPFFESNSGALTPLRPRTLRVGFDIAY